MHLTTDGEFGAWFETLHMAEPASLSLTRTVPAANEFPLLAVVDEKAENVAVPATLPTIPRISTVMSSLRMARTRPSYAAGLLVPGFPGEVVRGDRLALRAVRVLHGQREAVDDCVVLVPLGLARRERGDAVRVRVLCAREAAQRAGEDRRGGREAGATGEARVARALLDRQVDEVGAGTEGARGVELDVRRHRAGVRDLDALDGRRAGARVRHCVHRRAGVVVADDDASGREGVASVRGRARERRERCEARQAPGS